MSVRLAELHRVNQKCMTMTMDVDSGVPLAVDTTGNDISGLCVFKLSNASAVYESIYCRFFGPNKHAVVVSKGTRLEFFEIISTGLVARLALPLNGRIVILEAIPGNAANMYVDNLFIVTEKERYCVLRWDEATSTVITVDSGDIHDRAYRPIEVGQLSVVDSQGKWIAVHSVQGLIKILPVDSRKKDAIKCKESYNVRVNELQILDLQYTDQPSDSIVILHEGISGTKTLSCRTLDQREKDLKLVWTFEELESDAHMIIAVPQPKGGIIVIGDESIFYYNHSTNDQCAISLAPTRFTCFCAIGDDGYRFVLGGSDGGLYLLLLLGDTPEKVTSMKLESLGPVSIPSTLTYLDNGYLFVGSKFGPSQIVQLTTSRLPDGSFLNLIDNFPSLAPIVDFCATDMEGTGHQSLVACSGAYKHGGVSAIRKGLTLSPHIHIPLDSFGVCRSFAAHVAEDVVILLSSVGETRLLLVQPANDEVSELSCFCFIRLNTPTLGFYKLDSEIYVQVVSDGAYFGSLSLNNQSQAQSIVPPNATSITKCAVYGQYLALAFSHGLIVCYRLSSGRCDKVFECQSPGPVSALCLSFINSPCIFYASWDSGSVHFCGSDGAQRSWVVDGPFAGSLIRDVAYHHQNLFVSTGEGTLLRCPMSPELSASGPWSSYVLGKSEVKLYQNGTSLIACSNRPYMIATGINGELHTIPTNINHVNCMQLLSAEEVITITATDLFISRLPEIENMSGISFDVEVLGETVSRIAEVPRSKYLVALAANHSSSPILPRPTAKSRVVLLNKELMTSVNDYPLDENEVAHSILVIDGLSETGEPIIMVGTALVEQPGTEPSSGRLLTFSLPMESSSLSLINQIKTSGCVYSLSALANKHLIATVNGKTELYMWERVSDGTAHQWTLCDTKYSQILGVKSDACGDLVAVGDLMKSVTLFKFKEASGSADAKAKLESYAQSFETSWTTEVKIISPTKILAGDNLGNIFILETNVDDHFSPPRHRLDLESAFHLGEVVNKITAGSISTIPKITSIDTADRSSFLVATNTGSIYQLLSLSKDSYTALACLQRNMDRLAKHIGDFTVEGWRSFSNERRKPRHVKQFIDGDFVLSFLSLPSDLQEAVLSGNGIKDGEAVKDANISNIRTLLETLSNETRN